MVKKNKNKKGVTDKFVEPAKGTDAEKARYWLSMFEDLERRYPDLLEVLVKARKAKKLDSDENKSLEPFLKKDRTIKKSVRNLLKGLYPDDSDILIERFSRNIGAKIKRENPNISDADLKKEVFFRTQVYANKSPKRWTVEAKKKGITQKDRSETFLQNLRAHCRELEEKHGHKVGTPSQNHEGPDAQPK